MPTTLTVSNLSDLYATLAQAKGGETIQLAGGDYGRLALTSKSGFNITFPDNVTIISADPGNPAVFSGLSVVGAENLTFENIIFDYTFREGHPHWTKPFSISGSSNITVRNSTFDGDLARGVSDIDDGYGWGYGLGLGGGTNVIIENNEFFNFHRALVTGGGIDYVIRGNDIHHIRSDGMNFVKMSNVLIEGNYLHDFTRAPGSGDHADMIQFWTNGSTQPSVGITIRDNALMAGAGDSTQSIFMRNDMVDRGLAGREMFYQDVLIENNVIYNGHVHGITVGESNGLVISNNSVLHSDGGNVDGAASSVEIPKINVAGLSTNVTIANNITAAVNGWAAQTDWTVTDNTVVQDQNPNAPGHYGDVFIGSTLTAVGGEHHFMALPGGMVDVLGVGAVQTSYSATSTDLDARFHIAADANSGAARVFDARLTTSASDTLPADTQFIWNFGDGITAEGALVSHAFAGGGWYKVALTVTTPDGVSAVETAKIGIAGPQVVELGRDGGFITSAYGIDTALDLSAIGSADGLQLGSAGAASVARGHLAGLLEADNFTISLTLRADVAGSSGEVFRLHNSFIASVTKTGDLQFQLWGTESVVTLTTKGGGLADLATHDVNIVFDNGKLQLFVDGALNAETAMTGTINTGGTSGLMFGNPWGKTNFFGDLAAFEITVDNTDFTPDAISAINGSSMSSVTDPVVDSDPVLDIDLATDPAQNTTSDPVDITTTLDPVSVPNSLHSEDWTGFVLDVASLSQNGPGPRLIDDAAVIETDNGPAVTFDGDKGFVSLGRQDAYENSDQIAFSVDFSHNGQNSGEERLVWNHVKIGLTLKDDGILVQAATVDEGFKSFRVTGLGLDDNDQHRAIVMLDAATDRLQVVLDDQVVLDVQDGTNFNIVGAGGREWGWSLGTSWNRHFDGEVTDFRLGDRFEFLDGQHADAAAVDA